MSLISLLEHCVLINLHLSPAQYCTTLKIGSEDFSALLRQQRTCTVGKAVAARKYWSLASSSIQSYCSALVRPACTKSLQFFRPQSSSTQSITHKLYKQSSITLLHIPIIYVSIAS